MVSGGSSVTPRGYTVTPPVSVVCAGASGLPSSAAAALVPGSRSSASSCATRDGGTNTMRACGFAIAVSSRNSSTDPRPFWYLPSSSIETLVPVAKTSGERNTPSCDSCFVPAESPRSRSGGKSFVSLSRVTSARFVFVFIASSMWCAGCFAFGFV